LYSLVSVYFIDVLYLFNNRSYVNVLSSCFGWLALLHAL
jgi:hypothetical protein